MFKDAKRPADELVPAGLDMSIHGDISYATLEKPDLTGKYNNQCIFWGSNDKFMHKHSMNGLK